MQVPFPHSMIDAIRSASRRLVRELGFMGGDFAGTDLSPSAVHALIEIEAGGMTARDLGARLHLEKSSVSRMLRKLIETGDVAETPGNDARLKLLSLTDSGSRRVAKIHAFARAQVTEALGHLGPEQAQTVLTGLELYSTALATQAAEPAQDTDIEITEGYRTGLIAGITELHAFHYAQMSGFGQYFESVVAEGLAGFCHRLTRPGNAIWHALQGRKVVGSIAIDGEDIGGNIGHLRWFIVDDGIRGTGIGRKLLSTALEFADGQDFDETHLWTFNGLDAARHLYEAHGFLLAEERPGSQWGAEVLEQRFVRRRI